MQTGLIHRPQPAAVPLLAARSDLGSLVPPVYCNYQSDIDTSDDLGNDTYGCCVPVAALRSVQIRIARRVRWAPTIAQVFSLFHEWQPAFDPAAPNAEVGTDVNVAMTAWCKSGVHVLAGLLDIVQWTKIDPKNADHIRKAIYLTGGVLFSFNLPKAITGESVWDCAPGADPDTQPGTFAAHRVFAARYDADGVYGITWGLEVPITWDFIAAYGLAVDAVLSWDWFDITGLSPARMNSAQIDADMAALA